MALDLPALTRANGIRRNVTLRPINPTQSNAKDLAALYLEIVQVWERAIPSIIAGYDISLRDALTTDAPRDQSATIAAAQNEVSRLLLAFGIGLQNWTVRVERWHRDKWSSAVKVGTKVDLDTVLTATPVQETLEAFIERNVALVANVSDQAKARIADAVFRGYQQRSSARDVAKSIREAAGMARRRAINIAADQNTKLSSALDRERQTEAGIEKFKWRHSGKLHPREDHKARDGRIYTYAKPPDDMPGELPFCGCRAQAHLDIMDEL